MTASAARSTAGRAEDADHRADKYRKDRELDGLHEAGEQPVEMDKNRTELQGGLHRIPSQEHEGRGRVAAPRRFVAK